MSHYKAYPAYKDSGVEWLGEVPEHWDVTPLKWRAMCASGGGISPLEVESEVDSSCAVPVIGGNGNMGYTNRSNVDHQVLAVGRVGALCGNVHIVNEPAWITDNALVLDVDITAFDIDYLSNVLKSRDLNTIASKTAQPLITGTLLGDQVLPCPELKEQQTITAYLDRETARLDGLVSKKTRFIELLREKRQALITHAVTKGLDPSVKMKDSGVEWLGEVPEHWDALMLRRVASAVRTGGTPSDEPPKTDIENGVAWYTPGDFGQTLVLTDAEKQVSERAVTTGEAKIFPAGSVLIVSIGATLGKVGFIAIPATANQQINAVLPNHRVGGYFLAYSLSVKTDAMLFLANAATIGIMNQEKTKDIWLAVPPVEEQLLITGHIDRETTRIDTLISKTERSIELLKERRSALITAAVTGQIDLRDAA